jgi:hypothetical protein
MEQSQLLERYFGFKAIPKTFSTTIWCQRRRKYLCLNKEIRMLIVGCFLTKYPCDWWANNKTKLIILFVSLLKELIYESEFYKYHLLNLLTK